PNKANRIAARYEVLAIHVEHSNQIPPTGENIHAHLALGERWEGNVADGGHIERRLRAAQTVGQCRWIEQFSKTVDHGDAREGFAVREGRISGCPGIGNESCGGRNFEEISS